MQREGERDLHDPRSAGWERAARQDVPRRVAEDQSRNREPVALVDLERAPQAGDVARPVERRAEEPEPVLARRRHEHRAENREACDRVGEAPPDPTPVAGVRVAPGALR